MKSNIKYIIIIILMFILYRGKVFAVENEVTFIAQGSNSTIIRFDAMWCNVPDSLIHIYYYSNQYLKFYPIVDVSYKKIKVKVECENFEKNKIEKFQVKQIDSSNLLNSLNVKAVTKTEIINCEWKDSKNDDDFKYGLLKLVCKNKKKNILSDTKIVKEDKQINKEISTVNKYESTLISPVYKKNIGDVFLRIKRNGKTLKNRVDITKDIKGTHFCIKDDFLDNDNVEIYQKKYSKIKDIYQEDFNVIKNVLTNILKDSNINNNLFDDKKVNEELIKIQNESENIKSTIALIIKFYNKILKENEWVEKNVGEISKQIEAINAYNALINNKFTTIKKLNNEVENFYEKLNGFKKNKNLENFEKAIKYYYSIKEKSDIYDRTQMNYNKFKELIGDLFDIELTKEEILYASNILTFEVAKEDINSNIEISIVKENSNFLISPVMLKTKFIAYPSKYLNQYKEKLYFFITEEKCHLPKQIYINDIEKVVKLNNMPQKTKVIFKVENRKGKVSTVEKNELISLLNFVKFSKNPIALITNEKYLDIEMLEDIKIDKIDGFVLTKQKVIKYSCPIKDSFEINIAPKNVLNVMLVPASTRIFEEFKKKEKIFEENFKWNQIIEEIHLAIKKLKYQEINIGIVINEKQIKWAREYRLGTLVSNEKVSIRELYMEEALNAEKLLNNIDTIKNNIKEQINNKIIIVPPGALKNYEKYIKKKESDKIKIIQMMGLRSSSDEFEWVSAVNNEQIIKNIK